MQKQIKKQQKKTSIYHSIRVTLDTKNAAEKILKAVNDKKLGRKIKLDEILLFAVNLIEASHIKKLQDSSLTNEDHKELMRQYYIETRGKIGSDAFVGFLMGDDFPAFKREYLEKQKTA